MKKKDVKEIIKTALSLFLICAVAAGLLGAVNLVTAPKINANAIARADEARKEVLPNADSFQSNTLSDGTEYFTGFSGGDTAGYVFTVSRSGYGGEIKLMVGTDTNGAVTGISFLAIDETPGLGMNAKKDSFKEQFIGKTGTLAVVKNKNAGEGEILAITSATITSTAVTNAVNDALAMFQEISKGED